MAYTYWLLSTEDHWIQVTKQEYVRVERAAGFNNTMGQPDEPATSGFVGLDGSCGVTLFGYGPPDPKHPLTRTVTRRR